MEVSARDFSVVLKKTAELGSICKTYFAAIKFDC
jgi:hypothetical protein